jgi:hypothetical protein
LEKNMKTRSILVVALLALAAGVSANALGVNDEAVAGATVKSDESASAPAAAAAAPLTTASTMKPHSHSLEKVGVVATPPAAPKATPARDVHRHWRDAK